jgi:hypothetical protein
MGWEKAFLVKGKTSRSASVPPRKGNAVVTFAVDRFA